MHANTAKTGKSPLFISAAIEQIKREVWPDKLWDEAILEAEMDIFPLFAAPPSVRMKKKTELLAEYLQGTWRDLLKIADEPEEPELPFWTARCEKCGWQNTSGFWAANEVEAAMIANLTHGCCAYDAPPLTVAKMEADPNPLKDVPSEPIIIPRQKDGGETVIADNAAIICPIGNIQIQENPDYDFFCYVTHKNPDSGDHKIDLFTVIEYDELDEEDIIETADLDE